MENIVAEDLKKANLIMHNYAFYNAAGRFHSNSKVYRFTNEQLNEYEHFFVGRENMLSVIGSGDQIFNAILEGVKNVEAFDISRFPKYFLYLKKASIQALTREEFIDFFYKKQKNPSSIIITENIYNNLYFDKIRQYLNGEFLEFWDYMFSNYEWNSICEHFFFPESRIISYYNNGFLKNAITVNKFLQGSNYKNLQARIKDTRLKTHTGDILKLIDTFEQESDLVYLSNIHDCISLSSYFEMQEKLKLSPHGILLIYFFSSIDEKFKEKGYKVKTLSNGDYLMFYNKQELIKKRT